ncbi:DUF4307 domain-containing protein [Rathayibacter rathayi]|uniref:DUF4307 domain-containing protein n=1 Tax=Rathayibacter rathayi TaxID=33887 RepID=A0ABD6WCW0_RATRA|nr:DUF4307 domain-containing protein [Rathayibacter rathayi]AZZ49272.1 DUF4307 domain-containing protein [Rathayibacter rathayi]MWV73347.1 DUF4307 domain-containing protein [Rathayibacter rathayi NCPPB 2980 = VKM Ac-1601]PPF16419.1 DUF4307 domain-containing protein [Rathayibacter rathayi]PPF22292.1 DUF4307 domain-containing protein [Rathayibacter rathayi]PPG16116.1 DUF4307 domain-containing protein [Rathayibacter rathayi]
MATRTSENVEGTAAPALDPDAVRAAGPLATRYGRTSSTRRNNRWLFGGVALTFVAVFAAWVIWAGLDGARGGVDVQDTAHQVVDDRTVSVSFDLTAPAGREVACAVQALNEQSAVVGWLVVKYPASTERFHSHTETVRTTELANTGLISSCWLP